MVSKRQGVIWKHGSSRNRVHGSFVDRHRVAAGRTGALSKSHNGVCGGGQDESTCNVFEGRNKGKRCLPSNVDVLILSTRASVDMRQENAASWSDLPTSVLQAELLRRQANNHDDRPACGTAGNTKDYNMPLHVFALVLILVLSTLGQSCVHLTLLPSLTILQHAPFHSLSDGFLGCPFLDSSCSCRGTSVLEF